jgi:glycosyltransferase involved in cell wall biosynthesis
MRILITKTIIYLKLFGFINLIMKIIRVLLKKDKIYFNTNNIVSIYSFAHKCDNIKIIKNYNDENSINWFIPPFNKGSGGHMTIFRFIEKFISSGYNCRLIIVGYPQPVSSDHSKEIIVKYFLPLNCDVYLENDPIPEAKISIATSWQTAYYVRDINSKLKYYFVQDYEPYFYSHGSDYYWAEATYKFGFKGITAGDWLKKKLHFEYGMETISFKFSYDKDITNKLNIKRNPNKMLFYARPPTQRRGFELGVMAINELLKIKKDLEIIFLGWDLLGYAIPFKHKSLGIVPHDKLYSIYQECNYGLVLSFTNLSLLPVELMASGVIVISNKGENNEWFLNDNNSILVEPSVQDIVNGFLSIIDDEEKQIQIREEGFRSSLNTNWDDEIQQVINKIEDNKVIV